MKTPNVYAIGYSEGFDWLLPANDADYDLLRFEGKPLASSWKPVRMNRLKVSEAGQPTKPSDFPACSGGDMLMLSRCARDKLGRELEPYGEFLPLACEEGDFWAFNVTRLIDALDECNSELLRASDTGAILMIAKHAFRSSLLCKAHVFKLSQMVRGLIYVTDPFVASVRISGLRGLEFVQVWEDIQPEPPPSVESR